VALIGAKIPNGLEIKAAEIRKVPSQGMLCSLEELQFPKEWQAEDGIYQLAEAPSWARRSPSTSAATTDLRDQRDSQPRGRAFALRVAREVAALFGWRPSFPRRRCTKKNRSLGHVTNKAGVELCRATSAA